MDNFTRNTHWSMKHQKGFTLIELLIVIAIIGILAAVVIIAVNPGRQLAQANDARRSSEVNALLNAIGQYAVDHAGALPAEIDGQTGNATELANYQVIADTALCTITTTNCPAVTAWAASDDCALLDDGNTTPPEADLVPTYLTTLPVDPQAGATDETDYYVNYTSTTRRTTVGACNPQIAAKIEVTR